MSPGFVRLDRGECIEWEVASRREWLVTNGLGGYASGTVAGALTRSYHGLLIAALEPPVGRTLLVAKLEETVTFLGKTYQLSADVWSGGARVPRGYLQLEGFWLEGTIPCWRYDLDGLVLEKRVWMEQGQNTTYVSYRVEKSPLWGEQDFAVILETRALVNYRDHHGRTGVGSFSDARLQTRAIGGRPGLEVVAYPSARPFWLRWSGDPGGRSGVVPRLFPGTRTGAGP